MIYKKGLGIGSVKLKTPKDEGNCRVDWLANYSLRNIIVRLDLFPFNWA